MRQCFWNKHLLLFVPEGKKVISQKKLLTRVLKKSLLGRVSRSKTYKIEGYKNYDKISWSDNNLYFVCISRELSIKYKRGMQKKKKKSA